jgi:fructokinase
MMTSSSIDQGSVIVAIGESLFDCFEHRTILGGAPLNFIVHLRQLLEPSQGEALLVTRIGADDLGHRLLSEVAARGVSTDFIQCDLQRPTGQVQVELSPSGGPQYHIAEGAAWDYIELDDSLTRLAERATVVCFGTLAQRHSVSGETIRAFLAAAPQAVKVLDVNLRQHYHTPKILEASLRLANVVKLNEEELVKIASMLSTQLGEARSTDEQARSLIRAFNLQIIALTRGARGTVLFTESDRFEGEAVAAEPVTDADDVGAGDACCAALVFGLSERWPHERTLALANRLGAYVASQPGGTPRLAIDMLAKLKTAVPAS